MDVCFVSMTMHPEARHGLRNAEQYPTPIEVRQWRFRVVYSIGPRFSLIVQTSLLHKELFIPHGRVLCKRITAGYICVFTQPSKITSLMAFVAMYLAGLRDLKSKLKISASSLKGI